MITSFSHKGLEKFFKTGSAKGIDGNHVNKLRRQLDALDAATQVRDMGIPGWGLHELLGKRKGTWAVEVSGAWRLTFKISDGNAFLVDYEQYH